MLGRDVRGPVLGVAPCPARGLSPGPAKPGRCSGRSETPSVCSCPGFGLRIPKIGFSVSLRDVVYNIIICNRRALRTT